MMLFLLACTPWSDVVDREALWWGPPELLAAETGVELVPLPSGEPVGYWPRVVIGPDEVQIDNRAWFLSLPTVVFEEMPQAELQSWLVEPRRVARVVDGSIVSDARRGQLIGPVYDALRGMFEAHRDLSNRWPSVAEPDGHVLIVPAPGTSTAALREVIFTAGQATYGRAGLAGRVDGRVRMAAAFDSSDCALRMLLTQSGHRLQVSHRASSCSLPVEAFAPHARELARACLHRLDEIANDVHKARPERVPPDPEGWRCVAVDTLLGTGEVDVLLPALASVHAGHPDLHQGYLLTGVGGTEPPACETAPSLEILTADQLDSLCGTATARAHLEEPATRPRRGRLLDVLGRDPDPETLRRAADELEELFGDDEI